MCYIYGMETPAINIVGKMSDFLSCAEPSDRGAPQCKALSDALSLQREAMYRNTIPHSRSTNTHTRNNIDRIADFHTHSVPHPYGCQCEDCESFLYFNLALSRS